MHSNHSLSPLRIFIDPVKITSRGQGYSVSFNGETIITNTRNPAADACRFLVEQGYQGRMEMWDNERPYPRMVFPDIKKTARLTVSENERHGPRIVGYRPISDEKRRWLKNPPSRPLMKQPQRLRGGEEQCQRSSPPCMNSDGREGCAVKDGKRS